MSGSHAAGIRGFWNHRPTRPVRGGKLAGVSAAIGLRYGVDPIIVRVAFVTAALYGGSGVFLYLLCWLLFPKEHPEYGREAPSGLLALALIALLIPFSLALSTGFGAVSMACCLAALYLLHRNYHQREPSPATATPTEPNTWVYPSAPEQPSTQATQPIPTAERQPPSWDPLGAAPFAWDLPEPDPPEPDPPEPTPRRRSRRWITLATLGMALITAGGVIFDGAGVSTALAASLGVLGAGMVIGSFFGGGRGLIGVAIPLAAVAMVVGLVPWDGGWRGAGTVVERPIRAEQVAPRYDLSVGDITLDMNSLQLVSGRTVRTEVQVDAGTVVIHVPPHADVTAQCSADYGTVRCLNRAHDGQRLKQTVNDVGPDGPGGGRIDLNLTVSTGIVEVLRG